MDEHVLFPALGGNESIAFLIRKPLHCTFGHFLSFTELMALVEPLLTVKQMFLASTPPTYAADPPLAEKK